jgi:hypothetical protein
MKKQFFVIIMMLIPASAFSQDIIILKSSQRFDNCKIIKEDSLNVYFQFKNDGYRMIDTFANKKVIQDYHYGKKEESVIPASILENENSKELYKMKIYKFAKLKNTGMALGIGGGVLTMVGIILVSNASWKEVQTNNSMGYNTNNTSYETNDANGIVGILMIFNGVPIGITGIILGTIGSKNVKKYQEKLNNISFNVICKPQQQGLSMSYRF